jgi:hypothetical protein
MLTPEHDLVRVASELRNVRTCPLNGGTRVEKTNVLCLARGGNLRGVRVSEEREPVVVADEHDATGGHVGAVNLGVRGRATSEATATAAR